MSTRPLPGGRVELVMQWGNGKKDRATPDAGRKVKVERIVEALRHRAKARTTGGLVEVWDTSEPDSPITPEQVRGHRWAMRCEHGTVVGRRTQDEAMDDVRDPRLWCVDCVVPSGQTALPL